ncbi:MAG: AmmeMemoRadiSam system radical SAM enzyme [Spirochaetaceae bacterium]|jgi:pyruvate formate lyase activating enzyme|nr:AmmeMemoRadiSam system radical SAM enzyme [Spirochaetaceae bacterium]
MQKPQARYITALPENVVQCRLCPRKCRIPDGGRGVCGVRGNQGGAGIIPYYGAVTAAALDPIEKKPLYHYRPGSSVFSVGFVGCNLRCPFCQNWRISQNTGAPAQYFSPNDIICRAKAAGSAQIAYTYSEPLIHAEFLLDCMALARKSGIANVLVSNGTVADEAAEAILSLTDAANVDLKCHSEETYTQILGGDLSAAIDFIAKAWEMEVPLEVTTLVIPGLNDGDEEIQRCIDVLRSISPRIPWHLSAYHPDYTWTAPPTDPAHLVSIVRKARDVLSYVYSGNIAGEPNDTFCPHCNGLLVQRYGYHIERGGLSFKGNKYYCRYCGKPAPFRYI